MVCGKKLGRKFLGSRLVEPHFLIRNYCSPTVMRLLNSVGCCCPSSDERQLLSPLLQSRMSLRGLVAIGWCLYGDGEDGGVDAGTVTIIAFCTDRMPVCRRSRSFVLDSFLLPFQLQL